MEDSKTLFRGDSVVGSKISIGQKLLDAIAGSRRENSCFGHPTKLKSSPAAERVKGESSETTNGKERAKPSEENPQREGPHHDNWGS